jgi:hypothetical protein
MNNKKIRAYILKVKNMSNKTIHDLTVNVQGHHNDLKMDDAQITGGLKFDICGEYDNFNVSIPFLSKNDEFSVKLFVDYTQGEYSKPIITLRSPENFKKVGHGESSGFFSVFSGTSQKRGSLFSNKEKNRRKDVNKSGIEIIEKSILNKKALITTASIILLVCIVFLGTGLYKSISQKAQVQDVQSNTEQKSNTTGTSSNETAKNSSSNTSNTGKSESSSTKKLSKDGKNNEVKSQDSSSDSSSKTSDNKVDTNSEQTQTPSTLNTDSNKATENTKSNNSSSSDTKNQGTSNQSSDDKTNKNTSTSTNQESSDDTQVKKSNTLASEANGTSTSEKQQQSNSESGEN